jgi:hypothetical protein
MRNIPASRTASQTALPPGTLGEIFRCRGDDGENPSSPHGRSGEGHDRHHVRSSRRTAVIPMLIAAIVWAASGLAAADLPPAISSGGQGGLRKDGKPFRAIGVNYFSCFHRTLLDAADTSYEEGFRVLAEHKIPFARFMATGFWPKDMALYQSDREEYFRRLDAVVASAEKHGIGLIPSLFWYFACVPDLVGEPMDQWGNPQSKVHAWMREYVREVVTRYRDSPAIWAWEMGNEFALQASLPGAANHRARVVPKMGTRETRSERDELTFDMLRVAYAEFGKAVREHDKKRLISTGDGLPRPAAWHMEKEGTWTPDNERQFRQMLRSFNPEPVDVIRRWRKNFAGFLGSSKSRLSRWPLSGSSTTPTIVPTPNSTSRPTTSVPTNSAKSPKPTPACRKAARPVAASRSHPRQAAPARPTARSSPSCRLVDAQTCANRVCCKFTAGQSGLSSLQFVRGCGKNFHFASQLRACSCISVPTARTTKKILRINARTP